MSGAGETTQVTYIGRHTAGVLVPLAGGEAVRVGHGETADVPAEIAAGLLAQADEWAAPAPPPEEAPPGAAPAEETPAAQAADQAAAKPAGGG